MVEIVRLKRKPPVLTPSSIPCLRGLPTINMTQGCSLGCTYCYIQGYRGYPGSDQVILFENTAEVVQEELRRKRNKPRRIYFSPSSDAFQYLPAVREVTYATIRVLLEAGIEVSFLTKGFVDQRFIDLFRQHAQRVQAQVGITSLDTRLLRMFEPRAAPPEMRLEMMRTLHQVGVRTTARLDPLIPDITDARPNLEPLFAALHDAGITEAAASYVFLRPAFRHRFSAQLTELGAGQSVNPRAWPHQDFDNGCSGGSCIEIDERRVRFGRIAELAERFGINIRVCRCKNPSLATGTCQIAGIPDGPVDEHAHNDSWLF